MTATDPDDNAAGESLVVPKFRLERSRYRADLLMKIVRRAWTLMLQALSPAGVSRTIYFDITDWFGK